MNSEKFIYHNTPDFPYVYNGKLINTKDVIYFIDMILYDVWNQQVIDRLDNRYIGVYEGGILQEVIYIDYDNIMNTIEDLKKYM